MLVFDTRILWEWITCFTFTYITARVGGRSQSTNDDLFMSEFWISKYFKMINVTKQKVNFSEIF